MFLNHVCNESLYNMLSYVSWHLMNFFFLRFYLFIRQRQPAREGTQAGGVGEEEAGS